jgi:hypothetical protein
MDGECYLIAKNCKDKRDEKDKLGYWETISQLSHKSLESLLRSSSISLDMKKVK